MRITRMAAMRLVARGRRAGALLLSPMRAPRAAPGAARGEAATGFCVPWPELRKRATFPLDSPERLAWYFVPRDRVGVSLLMLDDAQTESLGPLLATALSPEGLLAARGVIKHENILRRIETEARRRQCIAARSRSLLHQRVRQAPATAPWAWRFEGHHLSVNVTQLPGQPAIVAPMFIGANPARVLSGPEAGFRLLAAEEDLGRELIKLLPEDRRKVR